MELCRFSLVGLSCWFLLAQSGKRGHFKKKKETRLVFVYGGITDILLSGYYCSLTKCLTPSGCLICGFLFVIINGKLNWGFAICTRCHHPSDRLTLKKRASRLHCVTQLFNWALMYVDSSPCPLLHLSGPSSPKQKTFWRETGDLESGEAAQPVTIWQRGIQRAISRSIPSKSKYNS